MFNKILIANRGEIAVRVIRTCKEMGIGTVAVYSDQDRNALHVRLADEAYALGGSTPRESYLNMAALIDAIKKSGAEAVHPGYGFYSENGDFAEAVEEAGVVFIGPPASAIRAMGDKVSARKVASRAGVAGVPGTLEPVESPEEILAFGEKYGWPVAIKAAYGGGGKGMKVVNSPEEAGEAMESAMRESAAAFGRSEVYLEKYLSWPRHIEMQVIGDRHGNIIWVSERDCSIQRRHQKLIEESPAPDFPDEIRQKMGEAAIAICKEVGYYNAGTMEFLYQDGEFYFLEMNTRLQVEHPVTEAITGLDLVRLQILVAAGEKLPISQHDIQRRGHAIELRINAEDPAGGRFLPSPGRITSIKWPDGPFIRTDTGYMPGDSVSQYYDNLIAKIIAWAPDRKSAIARMLRAVDELEIEGVATSAPAQKKVLEHPDFVEARHSTRWLEEVLDLSDIKPFTPAGISEDGASGFEEVVAEVDGQRFSVKVFLPENVSVARSEAAKPKVRSRAHQRSHGHLGGGGGSGTVTVPMQGTVVKVLVEEGQEVEVGQTLCVLEAMKMENNVTAPTSGKVKEVRIKAGDAVSPGDVLFVLE